MCPCLQCVVLDRKPRTLSRPISKPSRLSAWISPASPKPWPRRTLEGSSPHTSGDRPASSLRHSGTFSVSLLFRTTTASINESHLFSQFANHQYRLVNLVHRTIRYRPHNCAENSFVSSSSPPTVARRYLTRDRLHLHLSNLHPSSPNQPPWNPNNNGANEYRQFK